MSSYPYRYGLKLISDKYVNLESGETLINAKRSFYIYKWESALEFKKTIGKIEKNECGVPVCVRKTITLNDTGTWLPLLRYTSPKWTRITEEQKRQYVLKLTDSDVLTPMHLYFKEDKDFSVWLGPRLYKELFLSLI